METYKPKGVCSTLIEFEGQRRHHPLQVHQRLPGQPPASPGWSRFRNP